MAHDRDGGWQFLDGGDIAQADGAVVGLAAICGIDPTLLTVAALPRGFYAFRKTSSTPWQIGYNGEED